MKILSRSEEMILLAVWMLQDDAYCVPIRECLMKVTRKKWSFGSIYDPLDRLEKKKLLESTLSEPTKERGGRSKRIYRMTKRGVKALLEIRDIQETMWAGVPNIQTEIKKS